MPVRPESSKILVVSARWERLTEHLEEVLFMVLKKIVCNSAAVVMLGFGMLAVGAPAASAAPSGRVVDGCQAQIFNTAFSLKCTNAKASGWYQIKANCKAQRDIWTPRVHISKGSSVNGVAAGQCRHKVISAQVYKS